MFDTRNFGFNRYIVECKYMCDFEKNEEPYDLIDT